MIAVLSTNSAILQLYAPELEILQQNSTTEKMKHTGDTRNFAKT